MEYNDIFRIFVIVNNYVTKVNNLIVKDNSIKALFFKKKEMNKEFGFEKGWMQVQQKDVKNVKRKLVEALGIHNRTTWYQRLRGSVEPKASEYMKINSIFSEYGITDVWGKVVGVEK